MGGAVEAPTGLSRGDVAPVELSGMTDGAIGSPSVGPSAEPFAPRWKRRAVTIPTMLGATAAAIVLSPPLAVAAVAYDGAHLRLLH